jgi:hypothetical protein
LEPELKPMEFASRPCVLLKQSTNWKLAYFLWLFHSF